MREGCGRGHGDFGAKWTDDIEGKVGALSCRAKGQGIGGRGISTGFNWLERDWAVTPQVQEMEKAAGDSSLANAGICSKKSEAGSGTGKRNGRGVAGRREFGALADEWCGKHGGEGSQEPVDVLFGVVGREGDAEACLTRRNGRRPDGL